MSRKLLVSTLLIILITLLAACSPSKPAILSAADNGSHINVKVGEQIVITLEDNPSTGYAWEAKDLDTGMFQMTGEPTFISSNPGQVGSGGNITLTFKAIKSGTGSLTLVYRRPWETGVNPINTFTVNVTVK